MALIALLVASVKRGCPAMYCGTRPPATSAEARSKREIVNCGRKLLPDVAITKDRRFWYASAFCVVVNPLMSLSGGYSACVVSSVPVKVCGVPRRVCLSVTFHVPGVGFLITSRTRRPVRTGRLSVPTMGRFTPLGSVNCIDRLLMDVSGPHATCTEALKVFCGIFILTV